MGRIRPMPSRRIGRLLGSRARFEREWAAQEKQFEEARAQHAAAEQQRQRHLAEQEQEYTRIVSEAEEEVRKHNAAVDKFEDGFSSGDPDQVEEYFTQVLSASSYPEGFPRRFRLAYRPEPKELVIEYELPLQGVVPQQRTFVYIQKRDEIDPKPRPPKEIKERYASVIAQIALCTVREAFDVEAANIVDTVFFNGHVSATDRSTVQPIRPCLISLSATREKFSELVLADVDRPHASATSTRWCRPIPLISSRCAGGKFRPVKIPFRGGDGCHCRPRSRPDLLQMTPTEFEHLVRQLFEAKGMHSWVTQASRDDGVDAVATNEDPIMGGLCVIQAKRYRNTVDVESVRALAGAMDDKRATKGILVTTSWIGKASHDFVTRHGRIQLIEGSRLKQMLQEYLNLDVLISLPKSPPKHPCSYFIRSAAISLRLPVSVLNATPTCSKEKSR